MLCSSLTAAQQMRDKAIATAAQADRDCLTAQRRIVMYEGQIDGLLDELTNVQVYEQAEAMVTP